MVICVCNNINENSIRREVKAGCHSFFELQQRIPIADKCVECIYYARKIITEETYQIENSQISHSEQPSLI